MAKPEDDPLKSAVALAYSQTDQSPRVVAKGRGLIAEQIILRAREHGVYVHESPELVSLLMQIDLDQRIPPQLYIAVAELLAWIYRLEKVGSRFLPPRSSPLPEAPKSETRRQRAVLGLSRSNLRADVVESCPSKHPCD
ncbi:MAG: EscU/YscU/HrcU family type III secretion system export apparatus switch protein [Propionivibrio sp.]|nr:EscU/YscU/HrcU family type III secretion system export apparatus switch protein [Propionivibrio sp.]